MGSSLTKSHQIWGCKLSWRSCNNLTLNGDSNQGFGVQKGGRHGWSDDFWVVVILFGKPREENCREFWCCCFFFWGGEGRNVKFHPQKKLMEEQFSMFSLTTGSMSGIFTNIYRKNELNVGKHSIHGSYRYVFLSHSERQHAVVSMLTSFFRRQTSPVAANSQKGRLEKAPFCRLFNDRWCCWWKKSCTTWVVNLLGSPWITYSYLSTDA